MKNFLKKSIDTEFATDMFPTSYKSTSKSQRKMTAALEKQIAAKYGLDYQSMRRWKLTYYALVLMLSFALFSIVENRIPAYLIAFIFTIWILSIVFYFPKHFVYRFTKKIR